MKNYQLSHLSDGALLSGLAAIVARDRATTAEMLAHIAEVDARKLYLPAAHPSMHSYCVHVLGLSEQGALKRIWVARAARRYPEIFRAVADGRLHLSSVVLLTAYLTAQTAEELLAAAANKSKSEIERFLAERFPKPDVPTLVQAIPNMQPFPATVEAPAGQPEPGREARLDGRLAPTNTELPPCQHSPANVETPFPYPRVTPLAPQRFALQLTIDEETHDKLRYAQSLLGHQVPRSDVAAVLDRALDALIVRLEKQKFAATDRPRMRRGSESSDPRHVPARVKRAVWERDGGQCTFTSDSGQRCPAREPLEFDHMDEVARGGEATVDRLRLRCRAHNQYGAECTFGSEFMENKRQVARRGAARAREQETTQARDRTRSKEGVADERLRGNESA